VATNYNLAFSTELVSEVTLRQIQDLVGGEFADPDELFILPHLWVSVRAVDHPIGREVYRETWGVDMQTSVSFGLGYKTDLRQEAAGLMSVAASQLAVSVDADSGMTVEHDRRLMRRHDGVLYFYDWWPHWTDPSLQARLPQPYTLTSDDPIV
jgi:hypothetical protein